MDPDRRLLACCACALLAAAASVSPVASATGNEAAIAGAPAPESARCRSLRESLERLESRLRAGYRASEGEQLRARQRRLRAEWGAANCRWYAVPR